MTAPPSIYVLPCSGSFLNPSRYALARRKSSRRPSGISSILRSSSFISDTENVKRQNSFPHFLIFSSSTTSWINSLSGVISIPPSASFFQRPFKISLMDASPSKNCSINSSTSITRENAISFQICPAFSRSPIQTRAPFRAPTEVPATALIFTPASERARHAPI